MHSRPITINLLTLLFMSVALFALVSHSAEANNRGVKIRQGKVNPKTMKADGGLASVNVKVKPGKKVDLLSVQVSSLGAGGRGPWSQLHKVPRKPKWKGNVALSPNPTSQQQIYRVEVVVHFNIKDRPGTQEKAKIIGKVRVAKGNAGGGGGDDLPPPPPI